jgi:regulation of enolase protein 1 (concanavalin A-like superfamily)
MSMRGKIVGRLSLTPAAAVVIAAALLIGACSAPDKKIVSPTPTPKPSPTLLPAEPEAVTRPIDLSFSTYAENWPAGWQFVDPDENYAETKRNVRSGVLRLTVPTGKDLYADNMTAPRYIKAFKGDFQLETKLIFKPTENYQGAGLLIYRDRDHYVRLERAYGGPGRGGGGIRFDVKTPGEYKVVTTPEDIPYEGGVVELRLLRNGSKVLAFWRSNEDNEWKDAGDAEVGLSDVVVAGLIACNTAREYDVDFAYIRLAPVASP